MIFVLLNCKEYFLILTLHYIFIYNFVIQIISVYKICGNLSTPHTYLHFLK